MFPKTQVCVIDRVWNKFFCSVPETVLSCWDISLLFGKWMNGDLICPFSLIALSISRLSPLLYFPTALAADGRVPVPDAAQAPGKSAVLPCGHSQCHQTPVHHWSVGSRAHIFTCTCVPHSFTCCRRYRDIRSAATPPHLLPGNREPTASRQTRWTEIPVWLRWRLFGPLGRNDLFCRLPIH